MSGFVRVARADEIPPGTGRQVVVAERPVAVFNVDGAFYAIEGTCVHRGGPLGEGDLEETVVTCPWHGMQYDVTTGAVTTDPTVTVQRYATRVAGGDVLVSLEPA